jgi:hypothetical protein
MTEPSEVEAGSWWSRRPTWQKVALIGGAALVGLMVLGTALGDPEATTEAGDTTTTAQAETSTTSDAETTTTEVEETTTSSTAAESTTTSGAPTTTTEPEPTTTTTTVPVVFTDGTWLIGVDIEPGTYETVDFFTDGCYWERLSGLSGDLDDILANDNTDFKAVVEVAAGDEAFSSTRCGDWTYPRTSEEPLTEFIDGTWIVGDQIASGRYRNDGGEGCYWQRLSGFSGTLDDILANDNTDNPTIVDISSSDAGFGSVRCGTWTLMEG